MLKQHLGYIENKVENGKLPVPLNFIDAKKDLSVQVYLSDEYARGHESHNGKTEMWYDIDVDEGACLNYDFQHEVKEEDSEKSGSDRNARMDLQKVKVHNGDTYFVPAGTIHGNGKGILVAEIQKSFDVIYRDYDYNRVDRKGMRHELHFNQTVQVINMGIASYVSLKLQMVKYSQ
ncbi:TPA: class I mannose-6-phosphate isomerase [Streptococcus suis]